MVGSVDVEAAKDGVDCLNASPPGPRAAGYAAESSSKLWSVYLAESERHDKALAESWKGDMDGLLIFSGLFSAVVTAFFVASLQPMMQSNQVSGSTPTLTTSVNPPSLLRANALWCLSLLSSLLCALCATLVQQWARQYTQAVGRRTAAHQRARVRAFLLQGIERSGVKAVVEGAPALLHLAMFLFMAGLIDFTAPASRMLSLLSLGVLVGTAVFYLALSWFPLHNFQSPYHTPLSSALWYIKQAIRPLNFTNMEGCDVVVNSGSLTHGRDEYAMATVDGTWERDLASLSWTLSSLIDRDDCEPFIEGIAGFMCSEKAVQAPVIMHELVKRKDLGRHVLELLENCVGPAHDATEIRRRRAISGLSALRALTVHWFSDDVGVTLREDDPHDVWKWSYSFPPKMIDVTMSLRSADDLVISMHARCTAAVAVWRLLVDYDELGAYTKQKLVTVERLLAYLESTRDRGHRSTRRTRVRDKIKEKISHDLLAVWAQSTQKHIEMLRMNSPQPESKQVKIQNWDAEKVDLRMMRYLWEQNTCPPEAWLYDDVVLRHNETDSGESLMLDSVLAYLSLHAKLLHKTLKPWESSQQPLNAYVDEATECLDQWSSTTMRELMPKIIASGHVANVIQFIRHAILGPRRIDSDQVMILETLETIIMPIRALQGKLNERTQKGLLGLLIFLREQHIDVMFRDIDNLAGSTYQFIAKIGEKVIPLVVRGLGTPNLWQSAQSILFEYEDACPDLADTLSSAQTWIRGRLLHYQLSLSHTWKPLVLPAPSEPHTNRAPASPPPPLAMSGTSPINLSSPGSKRRLNLSTLGTSPDGRFPPNDHLKTAHKIMQLLYSPNGHFKENYIDKPVELELGNFIDTVHYPAEPANSNRRSRANSWARPSDGSLSPDIHSEPPSASASDSLEYESASSVKLGRFAPPMQASTSLQTAITAETEPPQDTKAASLPLVTVQQGEGSRGSRSPRSGSPSPSTTSPTFPQRNGTPPRRPSHSYPPVTVEGQSLGLYTSGDSGPIPLSAPSTRFHTPIAGNAEPSSEAQAFAIAPTLIGNSTQGHARSLSEDGDSVRDGDGWASDRGRSGGFNGGDSESEGANNSHGDNELRSAAMTKGTSDETPPSSHDSPKTGIARLTAEIDNDAQRVTLDPLTHDRQGAEDSDGAEGNLDHPPSPLSSSPEGSSNSLPPLFKGNVPHEGFMAKHEPALVSSAELERVHANDHSGVPKNRSSHDDASSGPTDRSINGTPGHGQDRIGDAAGVGECAVGSSDDPGANSSNRRNGDVNVDSSSGLLEKGVQTDASPVM